MANVLIIAYLLIVLAMIAVILLQRSEGGALGIGGGTGGGLVSARGSASLLTRSTAILAALFMATAIALSIVADLDRSTSSILESAEKDSVVSSPVLDALDALQTETQGSVPVPVVDGSGGGDAPATTTSTPAVPETPADAPDLALPGASN